MKDFVEFENEIVCDDKIFCVKCKSYVNKYYYKKHLNSKKHTGLQNFIYKPINKIKKKVTIFFN
jgi:hypothetical protein